MTHYHHDNNYYHRNFNSHAHVERDVCIITPPRAGSAISTHTLTWSVTIYVSQEVIRQYHFNSHAHVERDDFATGWIKAYCNFNSHAHVERDGRKMRFGQFR